MQHLGSLEGEGELFKEISLGHVIYRIDVWRENGRKRATGTLRASDEIILRALEAGTVTLFTMDGHSIELFVSDYEAGSGETAVIISGPVPGLD